MDVFGGRSSLTREVERVIENRDYVSGLGLAIVVDRGDGRFDIYHRAKDKSEYMARLDAENRKDPVIEELYDREAMDEIDYDAVMRNAARAFFEQQFPDIEREYSRERFSHPTDLELLEKTRSVLNDPDKELSEEVLEPGDGDE